MFFHSYNKDNPNIMCSGNNKILSLSTNGWFLTHFLLELSFLTWANPSFCNVCLLLGCTIRKEDRKALWSQTAFLGITIWLSGLHIFSIHILSTLQLSRANPYAHKFPSCGQSGQSVLMGEYFLCSSTAF